MKSIRNKSLFNFRPLCFWALIVAIAVVTSLFTIWATVGLFAVIGVSLCGIRYFGIKTHATRPVFIIGALCLVIAVIISSTVTTHIYSNQRYFYGEGNVQGIIRSMTLRDGNEGSVILNDVTFNDRAVSGRVFLRLSNMDEQSMANLRVGNIIHLRTSIHATQPSNFSVNNRIRYSANVNRLQINLIEQSVDIRSVVMRHTNDFLHNFLSATNAELIYSMIFGDRSSLDPEMRESFSATGIAHVLSVSGLHVGLVIGILVALLKFLRVPRKWQFLIILLTLSFYIYLCDFRYPILRSSIMFMVFLANQMFARRGDLLSSLSMAGIVVLVLFPYSIQSLSFQMTFACVLGIALFRRPLSQFFDKRLPFKDNKKLRKPRNGVIQALALDIGTTITVFPLLLVYFSNYPLVGVIGNIFFLPFVVLAFQLAVIAVFTFVGFPLLYLADFLLTYILHGITWLASLGANVYVNAPDIWFLFYFIGLLFLSRFIFIKQKYKYIAAGVCFAVYCATMIAWNL